MQLRPYQKESIDAVYAHLRGHDDNPCIVIPTAGGKTPVMATICKEAVGRWNGRVLILAHVKELLEQTVARLHGTGEYLGDVILGDGRGGGHKFIPLSVCLNGTRACTWVGA